MAQRLLEREEFMQNLPTEQQEEVKNFASQLLDRMRSFFGAFRQTRGHDPENVEPAQETQDSEALVEQDGSGHN
ncbi:hypothetical protein C2W62_26725 [Candidatus Entotheonella serta]|nr:hypothetical protein C2W62_26725 [Candidatus Entotheonella serta]